MLLLALAACLEPFGTDRHDLEGFRIAAVSVDVPGAAAGDVLVPSAAVTVDGRLWSDEPVERLWFWVEEEQAAVEAIDAQDVPAGEGTSPSLSVPDDTRRLALLAIGPDGTEARAFLDLPPPGTGVAAPSIEGLALQALPLSVQSVAAADLTADARAGTDGVSADFIEVGGFGRLSTDLGSTVSGETVVRWMSEARASWFELEPAVADLAAGVVVVDGDEVIERSSLAEGPLTVLTLAIDGRGGSDFAAFDVHVGPPGAGLWTGGGRWLPGVSPEASGPHEVVLTAVDDAPFGLAAVSVQPGDGASLPALPCPGATTAALDVHDLVVGRCLRADLEGVTALIEVR